MVNLGQAELRGVIEAAERLAGVADLPDLRRTSVAVCGSLIGADLTSYNEVAADRPALVVADPGDGPSATEAELMGKLIHQNPLVAHFVATQDGRARRFSDFLGDRELRRLPLHREIYRDIGVNFQVAITTTSPEGLVVGVALSRAGRDFTDAEVTALDLLRPHLSAVHRRLTEIDWLRRMLAAVDSDAAAPAVVLAGPDGSILRANPAALGLLGDDLPRLPAPLRGAIAAPREAPSSIVFAHRGVTLHARLGSREESEAIVVTLSRSLPVTARLAAISRGLSGREAEVLALLAAGGSNGAVARSLGVSRRTIEKHLENAYRKLGVGSRAEAIATLLAEPRLDSRAVEPDWPHHP
ncbi:MAG: LuxR C-terminal-related transcriptional regulator [Solirubrobacterales bacterium]